MPPAKRKSAFFSATQEAQKATKQESAEVPPRDHENPSQSQSDKPLPSSSMTVTPLDSETVEQFRPNTVSQQQSETVEQFKFNTVIQSNSETVEQFRSNTASQQQSETVKRSSHTTMKKQEKISFYLTTEQAEKLDDLAYEHKKRTGRRTNRNEIVRYLIDACSIEHLENLK